MVCDFINEGHPGTRSYGPLSANPRVPFGWQLAHDKHPRPGLRGQLASCGLAICHVCNAGAEHHHPLWNYLSYGAATEILIIRHTNRPSCWL